MFVKVFIQKIAACLCLALCRLFVWKTFWTPLFDCAQVNNRVSTKTDSPINTLKPIIIPTTPDDRITSQNIYTPPKLRQSSLCGGIGRWVASAQLNKHIRVICHYPIYWYPFWPIKFVPCTVCSTTTSANSLFIPSVISVFGPQALLRRRSGHAPQIPDSLTNRSSLSSSPLQLVSKRWSQCVCMRADGVVGVALIVGGQWESTGGNQFVWKRPKICSAEHLSTIIYSFKQFPSPLLLFFAIFTPICPSLVSIKIAQLPLACFFLQDCANEHEMILFCLPLIRDILRVDYALIIR